MQIKSNKKSMGWTKNQRYEVVCMDDVEGFCWVEDDWGCIVRVPIDSGAFEVVSEDVLDEESILQDAIQELQSKLADAHKELIDFYVNKEITQSVLKVEDERKEKVLNEISIKIESCKKIN